MHHRSVWQNCRLTWVWPETLKSVTRHQLQDQQQEQQKGGITHAMAEVRGRSVWQKCVWQKRVAELQADLGVADVEVPIGFRREASHHLPASGLEVGL